GEGPPPSLDTTAHSLRELETRPVVDVRPGPQRVRLELPWGSWTQVLNTSPAGQSTLRLPDSVGSPPLRVLLWSEVPQAGAVLLILGDEEPRVQLRPTSAAASITVPAERHLNRA